MKTNHVAPWLALLLVNCTSGHAIERYVSLEGGHAPPFTSWVEAATNIQAAIDAASVGDVIWVTNGVYNTGGKVMAGDLTNRVAVDKALTVQSANGPDTTVIEGQWDPTSTNGPGAVRCAWLTNGATLRGFALRDGATRSTGDVISLQSGGGVWGPTTNALVDNCILTNCRAFTSGGAAYLSTLRHSIIAGNSARSGGGTYFSRVENCLIENNTANTGGGSTLSPLFNCIVRGNFAKIGGGLEGHRARTANCSISGNSAAIGGGASGYTLTNCIVTDNWAQGTGGGLDSCSSWNSIVWGNRAGFKGSNYSGANMVNSCTLPLPSGPGNIAVDPQLIDATHISINSPCGGAGNFLDTIGTDIDGESWVNPASMGCDEVWPAGLTGPLSVSLAAPWPTIIVNGILPLTGIITGRATRLEWSFDDGPTVTNASYITSHAWTNPGDYTVTFTAFNNDNPAGVSTNLLVHVVPLVAPPLLAGSLSGASFSLSFPGQPGGTYVVEQTTNLVPPVTWQTVQTLLSTGELMQVTDDKATNDARFYRVRAQ